MLKFSVLMLSIAVSLVSVACSQSQDSQVASVESGIPESSIERQVSLEEYNRIYKGIVLKPNVTMYAFSETERWMLHSSSLEADHIKVVYFKENNYKTRFNARITVNADALPTVEKSKIVDLQTYNKLLSDIKAGYTMSKLGEETVYTMGFPEDHTYLKLYDFSQPGQPFEVLVKP